MSRKPDSTIKNIQKTKQWFYFNAKDLLRVKFNNNCLSPIPVDIFIELLLAHWIQATFDNVENSKHIFTIFFYKTNE